MSGLHAQLEKAWAWRVKQGAFESNQAVRVFHGPGDGIDELRSFAIDRFAEQYWVTEWQQDDERKRLDSGLESRESAARDKVIEAIHEFLRGHGAVSAVALGRP